MTILLAILLFGALIFVHELGHYWAARSFGVAISEFAIGMGPRLLSHTSKKTGIVYSLRLLPFGGFVSMVGEDEDSEEEGAFCRKPVWQRMIITAAGAAMNVLVGVLLMTAMVVSMPVLGTTTVAEFPSPQAASYQAGLREGDEIVKINRRHTHVYFEMVYEIMHQGSQPMDITVIRDGERIVLPDVICSVANEQGIAVGERDFLVYAGEKTAGTVLKNSVYQSATAVKLVWDSLVDLVRGRYGMDQLSGPVGVTSAIGSAAQEGHLSVLYLCGIIAMNLGIVNLLPLPALDGGRLLFQLIEAIRGKPLNPTVEGYIHFAGLVILMGFMVVVTVGDVLRLFRT